eukprot:9498323-Heterocapsa_arctica.AAC.1
MGLLSSGSSEPPLVSIATILCSRSVCHLPHSSTTRYSLVSSASNAIGQSLSSLVVHPSIQGA